MRSRAKSPSGDSWDSMCEGGSLVIIDGAKVRNFGIDSGHLLVVDISGHLDLCYNGCFRHPLRIVMVNVQLRI